MNYTYTTTLLLFFCLLPAFSFAQNLKIVYDAQSGAINYYDGDDQLSKPCVKKGGTIELSVTNYNNYLYDVDIRETHEKLKFGTTDNAWGKILEGAGLTNLLPVPSDADADGVIDFIETEALPAGRSETEMRIWYLKQEAETKLNKIHNLEDKFQQTGQQIGAFEKKEQFQAIALQEIEKLKMNPHLPPQKIKTYALDIIENGLEIYNNPDVSVDQVLRANDGVTQLTDIQSVHSKTTDDYELELAQLRQVNSELVNLAPSNPELVNLYFEMEKTFLTSSTVLNKSSLTNQKLDDLMEVAKAKNPQEILDIFYEFQAIRANDFKTVYHAEGEEDLVIFDLTFALKQEAQSSGAKEEIKLSPIKVPVYGGLKMNASIGISFGQFFKAPESFYVRDSAILAQKEDRFTPMVTSFLHFYQQGRKPFTVGGSLGVGVPVGGELGFQSINFFVGPSFFFGSSERFVLNLGLMGGKVQRLSAGYKAGDYFDGESEFIPLHQPYELGYFVGLSFNVGR